MEPEKRSVDGMHSDAAHEENDSERLTLILKLMQQFREKKSKHSSCIQNPTQVKQA